MNRRLLLIATIALVVFVAATPALAHVTVSPEEAARGTTTTFTFSVPNEIDSAKTVKVEIFFPDDAAFDEVNAQPVAGWTAFASKESAVWQGGSISGDDKVEFALTVGPMPNGDSIVFKALQTYDNGEVVRWIDASPTNGAEPEHPAPVVTLTGPAAVTTTTTEAATTTPAGDDNGDSGDSNVGVIVLVAALVVVAAGVAFAVRRRRTG